MLYKQWEEVKTNQPDLWEEINAWPPMVGEVAGNMTIVCRGISWRQGLC